MRVLLAVDHSPASEAAVTYLRALPFRPSVDLQVVTVVPPFTFTESPAMGGASGVDSLIDQERVQAESALAASIARFNDDGFRSVSGEVRVGVPGHELTAFSEQHDVKLIVLGAIGRSAIERVLLGSVSEYVANRTLSSVLVVRPRSGIGIAAETVPRRVLIALDQSDQDLDIANWLRHLELPTNSEVHLVHVMQLMTFYRKDIIQRTTDMWKQSQAAAELGGRSLADKISHWGFATESCVIAAPHIGNALVSYSDEHNCELIITGDRRRGVLNRLFLGSVSRHVLRYAKSSVLVAREN